MLIHSCIRPEISLSPSLFLILPENRILLVSSAGPYVSDVTFILPTTNLSSPLTSRLFLPQSSTDERTETVLSSRGWTRSVVPSLYPQRLRFVAIPTTQMLPVFTVFDFGISKIKMYVMYCIYMIM